MNYFDVLNTLGDGIICVEDNYRVTYANQKAMSVLGLHANELILHDVKEVFNVTSFAKDVEIHQLLDSVLSSGNNESFKTGTYLIKTDGKMVYLSASISRVASEDKPPFAVINFREITKIVNTERAIIKHKMLLEHMVEALPIGVIILDYNRNIIFYNSVIQNKFVLDRNKAYESVGALLKCEHSEHKMCGLSNHCQDCSLGKALYNHAPEKKVVRKHMRHLIDGKKVSSDYEVTFVPFEDDKYTKIMILVNDITEQLEKEAVVKYEKKVAESEVQRKSDMVQNMSVEIRKPIDDVLKNIKRVARNLEDQEQLDSLLKAQEATRSLSKYLDNLIDLASIEVGEMPVYHESFQASQLFKEIFVIYKEKAKHKHLELEMDISSLINKYIITDYKKVQKIIINLLHNAVKFTDEGRVKLKGFIQDKHLVIKVKDTGRGIEESLKKKIYESFKETDGLYAKKIGGAGLSVTKMLTHMLNGDITLETTLGKGSVFTVRIPLLSHEHNQESHYVLIAEDDPIQTKILQVILERLNFDVVLANNGRGAVEAYKNKRFSYVFMATSLPVISGVEAIEKIKDINDEVIAIGLCDGAKNSVDLTTTGFDYLIYRPYTMDKIQPLLEDNFNHINDIERSEVDYVEE